MSLSPNLQDWALKNECFPSEDNDNYYITVESEYESPGNEKEKRLSEAVVVGVDKLLKFYGKDTSVLQDVIAESSATDYEVSLVAGIRMKVLVAVPKVTFDAIENDPAACNINKPEEGYLSAFIPVGQVTEKIDAVVAELESLIMDLVKSDKFISNVSIDREAKRLKIAEQAIKRYINLNNIAPVTLEDPECFDPKEIIKDLELGFTYDYKAAFALVEKDQYTIGYDCFLETPVLNHITTINYLTRLDLMLADLEGKFEASFNVFDFLSKHTLPIPVIETKQDTLDGVGKYDEDGDLFSFANMAKLITLDLDSNSCKTDEERATETRMLSSAKTKKEIAATAKETSEYVGNNTTSAEGVADIKAKLQGMDSEGGEKGVEALDIIFNDVLAKVNLGVVLEDTIQGLLVNMTTSFGESVVNDPELEKAFALSLKKGTDPAPNDCTLKIGFPTFQGITLPSNLPTLDWLAEVIDTALANLFNILVSALSSLILGILEGLSELSFSSPDGLAGFGEGFKTWFSKSIGVDLGSLSDPEAWADALTSSGGTGFLGVLGRISINKARKEGSEDSITETYTETATPIKVSNSETGETEEKFILREFLVSIMSDISSALETLEAILTPTEMQSVYKGTAKPETNTLAFKALSRNGNSLFQSEFDVQDIFSAIGRLLKPQFLLQGADQQLPTASNITDIGDGSDMARLRASYLQNKDPDLTSEEIDEIINKEKAKKKGKILKALEALQNFCAGDFAPDFPNVFGDDGLITELPPVIKETSEAVTRQGLQGVLYNFSIEAFEYSDIWNAYFNQQYGLLDELTNPYFNGSYWSDIFGSGTRDFDIKENSYVLGYTPGAVSSNGLDATVGDVTKTTLGPYTFGKDIDIRGIPRTNLNGEESDNELFFDEIIEELQPYILSTTHTFKNSLPKAHKGYLSIFEDFQSSTPEVKAQIYAYLLLYNANELQGEDFGDNERMEGAVNYQWKEIFKETDEPQLFDLKVILDNDNDTKKNTNPVFIEITTYANRVEVFRQDGIYNKLLEVEVDDGSETKPLSLKQTSEDYYISGSAAFLGRQISTGKLDTEEYKYFNLSLGSLTDGKTGATLSRSNSEVTSDIYKTTKNKFSASGNTTPLDMIKDILEDFSDFILEGTKRTVSKYSMPNSLQDIKLLYPKNDILDLSGLEGSISELTSQLLSASVSGEYCDALGPVRRTNSISSIIMLVRLFIVERAMIAIQATNGFDIDFMQSDLFISSIYKRIKTEVQKYKNTFDTIPGNLFPDMRDTAAKYYEILKINDENIEVPETGKDAFLQLITEQIQNLRQPIIDNLELRWDSSTWDGFLIKVIFGEIDELDELEADRGTIVDLYSNERGFVFKRGKTTQGSTTTYTYDLLFVKLNNNQELKDYSIISVQCGQDTNLNSEEESEVYSNLINLMKETKEYQILFNNLVPIKNMIASLSLYEFCALSDTAVYPATTEAGINLGDMLTKTKLSILQIFCASIYGNKKITYTDPFLEKAGTDLVS